MSQATLKKILGVLKVLLQLDDIEVIKYTIESLIEELEDMTKKSKS